MSLIFLSEDVSFCLNTIKKERRSPLVRILTEESVFTHFDELLFGRRRCDFLF